MGQGGTGQPVLCLEDLEQVRRRSDLVRVEDDSQSILQEASEGELLDMKPGHLLGSHKGNES